MEGSAGTLLSLLLRLLLTSSPGAPGHSPGLVARITDKGLEYVAKEGLVGLQRKLHGIALPDFTGDFRISHLGRVRYEFHSLDISSCELLGSALTPLPGQGLSLAISDSSIGVHGKWKVRKSFVKLDGSFDVWVKDITTSVNLLLGSEPSGRPTVTVSSCSSHISDVEVDVSGDLGWLLNLFHSQIESRFQEVLESKICEKIQNSVTSDLQPYLQTLPVTTEMDSLASIDYSLMQAPRVTDQVLDVMFKGEIFNHNHRSPVPFGAPVMSLPEECNRMVYFAISDYVFNTASLVYQEAGYLNFSITDDMIPPESPIRLTTKSFRPFIPRATNVSAVLTFNITKITGFLKPGKVHMELKESKVGVFNVEVLEALLNVHILNSLYPKVNDKLAKGLPLPLLKHIRLYDLVLQIHKDFLFLGANVQYTKV
ncbi:lipopolysaccharide-binding protein isoform X2 [Diceros bicornis minor]|uniref:lipopolysaccharide-binding protein isoform X2 n=1 Tax=Diceros bicornis minor TaxID=77932 RepID=UPI0026EF6FCC|nr:lipopolysaccharide-binding protein isoform X2 [Diceros bicornis minor]